jgi:hypothetical protein
MNGFRNAAVAATARLSKLSPVAIAFSMAAYSFALLLLSAALDLWDYDHSGQQVGYAHTLNWFWGFTFAAPLFAFFLLRTANEIEQLPPYLASAEMVLDREHEPNPRAKQLLASSWTRSRSTYAPWWLAISLFGLVFSLGEWLATSALPLFGLRNVAEGEYDWSVKFIDGSRSEQAINAAFSFLAFLQQIWLLALIAYLVFLALAMSGWITDLRAPEKNARLFPSLRRCGADPRLGYERFAPAFQSFLLGGLFLFTHFFLSRVWNAYLHPEKGSEPDPTILSHIKQPFQVGLEGLGWKEFIPTFLEQLGAHNYSGVVVSVGALLLLLLSIGLLGYTLRRTVIAARDELLGSQIPPSKRKCLEAMAIWPLRFPSLTMLLALGALGAASMFAYRLGLYFVGALVAACIAWAVGQVRKG